ncbi:MAG: L,D-transpeptidase [Caldimonas sp.]|uniref:L,D-transpeptidase family protein n=1 Tax=Caldimonas taiwanensis TaxID=307483 RepID=UPI000A03E47A|nr:L,D-transpeptidase family protein [Caldimonas taiwanensis]GIX24132.1 MAG: L,D-transpeptidase [Caldimonas sp.]
MRRSALCLAICVAVCAGIVTVPRTVAAPLPTPWLEHPESVWAAPVAPAEAEALRRFYALGPRGWRWFDAQGRARPGLAEALSVLAAAEDDGLHPADYQAHELARAVGAALDAAPNAEAADVSALDVRLSLAVLRLLRDLHLGRVDPRRDGWKRRPATVVPDFAAVLHHALEGGRLASALQALRPAWPAYEALRVTLPALRAQAARERQVALPVFRPGLRPGQSHPQARQVFERLRFLGELPGDAPASGDPDMYDPAWEPAVRRFQARHGLNDDGVIGPSTVAALNVPLWQRVRQVELSLERLRWMPFVPGRPLIVVNVPMFRLWAYADATEAPVLESRVIVGRSGKHPTPSMMEELRYLVFRPYWNVPPSILREEELPRLEADPGYLQRHDKEVVAAASDHSPVVPFGAEALAGLRAGSLRLRQKPGPANALGAVKFMMPNDEAIYLHDTPSRGLFLRERRDFSHGCVRVQEPAALATWLLRDQPPWNAQRVAAAMRDDAAASQYVRLESPVSVALVYLTAWAEAAGAPVRFADDVYRRDAPLARALQPRRAGR